MLRSPAATAWMDESAREIERRMPLAISQPSSTVTAITRMPASSIVQAKRRDAAASYLGISRTTLWRRLRSG